ncbi:TfoX/Sxy family protein [Radicibacter daui]|uniref:TfoX/Sxy family protein n=1 Tax=Radicibacter daui TaxID=3064829 RepID=UPI004046D851
MARDPGLEELIREHLEGVGLSNMVGLSEQPMFGGLCWLLRGNLLCGAKVDAMLIRLGKGNEGWALEEPGITPMVMQGRGMPGWVWADPDAFADDALRARLLDGALTFVNGLPAKL